MIKPIIDLWRSRASRPDEVEVCLTCDEVDARGIEICKSLATSRDFQFKYAVQKSEPFNCVKGWNLAAQISTGKVLIAVSDDFTPPQFWDEQLLSLRPGWTHEECVVHVDDGFVRTICTLPIITRSRYDRFGYFYFPGYSSLFCDTELTERAEADGVVIDAMHILFEHEHPDCGKRARDASDLVHASKERWSSGEVLFNARKKLGFPSFTELDQQKEFVAYFQVTKDDFCLAEVCQRLVDEGVRHFRFCVPDEYWSGRKVTHTEIAQVEAVNTDLANRGFDSKLKEFVVAPYRKNSKLLVDIETGVRNESLSWIRSDGFSRILIVDGDELWPVGTLHKIQTCIYSQNPDAISFACVPTIGLPGLPIEGATDKVVVYIGNGKLFDCCRTPRGTRVDLVDKVIHFTATRKSMAEIIQKHRESGHYDDPNYDFEGWITNTLPKVHVGMRNAHMYRPNQIWPVVRAWTKEELDGMPESILEYLSKEEAACAKPEAPRSRICVGDARILSRQSNYHRIG